MKMMLALLCAILLVPAVSSGQFRSQVEQQPSVSETLLRPSGGIGSLLGGLFDPNRFMMRHNVSLSYMTFGGAGMSRAAYTNSMFYQISNPLDVRFDVTLQGSPFGSAGVASNRLNGISLSRAELNYRPSENTLFRIQYRELPATSMWWDRSGMSPLYWGDE